MDVDLIQSQFAFQSETAESVVLVYDPERTSQGSLSLKAFRLSDKYMDLHREGAFSKPGFAKHEVSHENVFEEIPLVVRSSNLTKVLLTELEAEVCLRRHPRLSLYECVGGWVSVLVCVRVALHLG